MTFTPTEYNPYDFGNRRHIGPSPMEMEEMLQAVGAASLEALIEETVPKAIRQAKPLSWAPLAEHELLAKMSEISQKNRVMTSLIGQGYYGTVTPRRSSATSWKTRPGTPPTPPISPRSRKAGLRRS